MPTGTDSHTPFDLASIDWTEPQAAMGAALRLAERAIGLSEPNPRVGCVIVSPEGQLLGLGHTQAAGGAHAEVMALQDAAARGLNVAGATAYVSLEPCAHQGRTPPCCDALIAAGLGQVHAALEDPNPLVAGQGLARLRAAGITTSLGLLREPASELNIGFLHRMRTGRPFVRLKWASSLDGRVAHPDGHSQWVTGPDARADTQQWRRRAAALLTGIGTALADDPQLNVRVPVAHQPLRVLLDGRLRLPPSALLLQAPGRLLILHGPAPESNAAALRAAGAELHELPLLPDGRLDLSAALAVLGARGINELHLEAGPTLNSAWLSTQPVDELLIYLAPRLMGLGRASLNTAVPNPLDDAHRWRWVDIQPVGDDLRLRLRPPTSPSP